uniref:FHA domain-containing protein n=1 Tax=Macrostomum lignano TaxID=282301 RepID=A0A1I8IP34_9PLAT
MATAAVDLELSRLSKSQFSRKDFVTPATGKRRLQTETAGHPRAVNYQHSISAPKQHQQQQQQQQPIRTYSLQRWLLGHQHPAPIGSSILTARKTTTSKTTAAGSSTITRTRSLATIPTVVQPARLHQRNQKRRARAPAAGSNKEPLPCLEQFLARSLTQVMQNRPSSGWSAERHAYAVEKVTCWLPEVGKARCLDDLLATDTNMHSLGSGAVLELRESAFTTRPDESEAKPAVLVHDVTHTGLPSRLSILRTKVQRDFGLTQEDSHSFITSPNCLSMLSCRSLRAPQTSPSSNRPSATASSRSLHCSSMREDSSNTPRRSLALSPAAIELSNSCSTAKSLSFCLAASVLALRFQHLHVRSQTVADEPQRLQPGLNSGVKFAHSVGVSVQVSLAQRLQCLSSGASSRCFAGAHGADAGLNGLGHDWQRLEKMRKMQLLKLVKPTSLGRVGRDQLTTGDAHFVELAGWPVSDQHCIVNYRHASLAIGYVTAHVAQAASASERCVRRHLSRLRDGACRVATRSEWLLRLLQSAASPWLPWSPSGSGEDAVSPAAAAAAATGSAEVAATPAPERATSSKVEDELLMGRCGAQPIGSGWARKWCGCRFLLPFQLLLLLLQLSQSSRVVLCQPSDAGSRQSELQSSGWRSSVPRRLTNPRPAGGHRRLLREARMSMRMRRRQALTVVQSLQEQLLWWRELPTSIRCLIGPLPSQASQRDRTAQADSALVAVFIAPIVIGAVVCHRVAGAATAVPRGQRSGRSSRSSGIFGTSSCCVRLAAQSQQFGQNAVQQGHPALLNLPTSRSAAGIPEHRRSCQRLGLGRLRRRRCQIVDVAKFSVGHLVDNFFFVIILVVVDILEPDSVTIGVLDSVLLRHRERVLICVAAAVARASVTAAAFEIERVPKLPGHGHANSVLGLMLQHLLGEAIQRQTADCRQLRWLMIGINQEDVHRHSGQALRQSVWRHSKQRRFSATNSYVTVGVSQLVQLASSLTASCPLVVGDGSTKAGSCGALRTLAEALGAKVQKLSLNGLPWLLLLLMMLLLLLLLLLMLLMLLLMLLLLMLLLLMLLMLLLMLLLLMLLLLLLLMLLLLMMMMLGFICRWRSVAPTADERRALQHLVQRLHRRALLVQTLLLLLLLLLLRSRRRKGRLRRVSRRRRHSGRRQTFETALRSVQGEQQLSEPGALDGSSLPLSSTSSVVALLALPLELQPSSAVLGGSGGSSTLPNRGSSESTAFELLGAASSASRVLRSASAAAHPGTVVSVGTDCTASLTAAHPGTGVSVGTDCIASLMAARPGTGVSVGTDCTASLTAAHPGTVVSVGTDCIASLTAAHPGTGVSVGTDCIASLTAARPATGVSVGTDCIASLTAARPGTGVSVGTDCIASLTAARPATGVSVGTDCIASLTAARPGTGVSVGTDCIASLTAARQAPVFPGTVEQLVPVLLIESPSAQVFKAVLQGATPQSADFSAASATLGSVGGFSASGTASRMSRLLVLHLCCSSHCGSCWFGALAGGRQTEGSWRISRIAAACCDGQPHHNAATEGCQGRRLRAPDGPGSLRSDVSFDQLAPEASARWRAVMALGGVIGCGFVLVAIATGVRRLQVLAGEAADDVGLRWQQLPTRRAEVPAAQPAGGAGRVELVGAEGRAALLNGDGDGSLGGAPASAADAAEVVLQVAKCLARNWRGLRLLLLLLLLLLLFICELLLLGAPVVTLRSFWLMLRWRRWRPLPLLLGEVPQRLQHAVQRCLELIVRSSWLMKLLLRRRRLRHFAALARCGTVAETAGFAGFLRLRSTLSSALPSLSRSARPAKVQDLVQQLGAVHRVAVTAEVEKSAVPLQY